METITLKRAVEESGKISLGNTKMPSTTFAISAKHCGVGGKLISIKGSTCSRCYAFKLQNLRPSVDKGWTNNLFKAVKMIKENPALWAKMVAFQIERGCKKLNIYEHRWFDSGDVYSLGLAEKILEVMQSTPHCNHWLPTRMHKFSKFKNILAKMESLPNVVVRKSSDSVHGETIEGLTTSTIVPTPAHATNDMTVCEAYQRAGKCGTCRACWNKDVKNVSYGKH